MYCSSNKRSDQRRQGEVDGLLQNVMLRSGLENDDAANKSVVLGALSKAPVPVAGRVGSISTIMADRADRRSE
jgi:hypothetical protein